MIFMKKSDLNAVAMALIGKITTLEGHCEHSEEVNKAINIAELRRIKASLEGRYLSEISALPDDSGSKRISSAINTYQDVILKADRIAMTLLAPTAPEERLQLLARLYHQRIDRITTAREGIPDIDTMYLKDTALRRVFFPFKHHKDSWEGLLFALRSQLATTTNQEKTYKDGIDLLDAYYDQFINSLALVNARYAELHPIIEAYNRAVELKQLFFAKALSIRSLSSATIAAIATHDKIIAEKIRLLQEALIKLDKMVDDCPTEFLSKLNEFDSTPHDFVQMERTTAVCFQGLVVYDNELQALTSRLQALASKLEAKIVEQKKHYEYFLALLEEILTAEHPAKGPIDIIKAKFGNAFAKTKPHDQDQYIFLHEKYLETSAIVEEIRNSVREYTEQINAQLTKKNKELAKRITDKCLSILALMPNFELDEEEQEPSIILNAIKESCRVGVEPDITPSFIDLRNRHAELVEKFSTINRPFEQLERVIAIHRVAKEVLAENINIEKLARRLNTTNDGARLSIIFERYWSCEQATDLLEKLSTHLHLFVLDGRKQVAEFIKNRGNGPTILAIKKKLAFIDLLSSRGIEHCSFLEAPYVVDAALLLEELHLTHHITFAILNNEMLCRTLLVLNERGIKITSEVIDSLSNDANKCSVICQLNEDIHIRTVFSNYENFNCFAYTLEEFKALINYFLKADEDTAKALHRIQASQVIYCKPWLVCLVNEIPELKASLCARDFDINWHFLLPLFEQFLDSSANLSTYTKLQVMHGIGKENVESYMEKYREHLLAIQAAQHMDFNKRVKLKLIMEGFNDFYKEYKATNKLSANDIEALENFRLAMIPVLLNSPNLHQSKVQLEALAKEYFKSKYHNLHIFFDVLQFLTLTFIIIMPIQYALNRNVLFSHDTTTLCSAVIGKVTDAFGLNTANPDSWLGRLTSRVRS